MKLTTKKIDLKQKLNKRETLIFFGTILVAVLGFYKSCIVPGIQEISETKQKIELLAEERTQLIAQINAEKEKQIAIPTQKQLVGALESANRSINAIARPMYLDGIIIQGISLTEVQNKDNPFYMKRVTLTVSGSFSAIGRYIEYLESLPTPLVIDTISIAHDGLTLSNLISKLQGGFHVSTQN